jgi:hypothetical protein
MNDVSALLGDSINRLRRGELDPKVANAMGYLSSVLLRALEQGSLEERMAKLESMLGLVPGTNSDHRKQSLGKHVETESHESHRNC